MSYALALQIYQRQRLVYEAVEAGVPSPIAYARAAKVQKIMIAIPEVATFPEVTETADALEAATVAERNEIAAAVGVRSPSDDTWRAVVKEARRRRPCGPHVVAASRARARQERRE